MHFQGCEIYTTGGRAGNVIFQLGANNTIDANAFIDVIGGVWETHSNITVLSIPSSSQNQRIHVKLTGVDLDAIPATTMTLINNANANWVANSSYANGLFLLGCKQVATGTITIGTTLIATNFTVRIENCPNLNPINKITNCFDNTGHFIKTDGAAAVPVASQDYRVDIAGIVITAANSTNTNNAIIIKDGAGNAITAAAGTLSGVYVPYGFLINWGAFTGTAGACTVCFV
jgi:hypothetical protein